MIIKASDVQSYINNKSYLHPNEAMSNCCRKIKDLTLSG